MTKRKTWIVLSGIVGGLLCDRAPVLAQSTSDPVVAAPQAAPSTSESLDTEGDDFPWGHGVPLEDRKAAHALFLEGVRLFRVPIFSQAAAKYSAALGKWKHPAIYFNLAIAQLNLDADVAARDNFEHAMQYGVEPLGEARFREAQKQLRELEQKLGRIRIQCATRGAVVTLDGVTLLTCPGTYQGWVQAKTHELTARARDYLSESKQITVQPGSIEHIDLKLVTLNEATDRSRRWATWKPWAVVGAGAAIGIGGGAFHFLSTQNAKQYGKEFVRLGCANTNDQSPDAPVPIPPGCADGQLPPELNDRLARSRQQHKIAIGAYITGGAVAAAGVVLAILNRPRLTEQPPPSSSGRRVSVVPTLSPDMVGIVVNISP